MTWDFAEANPFAGSVGDWMGTVSSALGAFRQVPGDGTPGRVRQADARWTDDLQDQSCLVVTDPPYFAAVGYSDLSDFFYPWLRLALRDLEPEIFRTRRAPKDEELIADPARHAGGEAAASQYFIDGFVETFSSLRRVSREDLPIVVLYAYKEKEETRDGETASGWEAMLQAILDANLQITGTWPIAATGATRLRSQDSNALASYVALVCRERPLDAARSAEREVANEIRSALAEALPNLQAAAILPVDVAQAVLGPLRADAGLEQARSAMNANDSLYPDSGYVVYENGVTVTDAAGQTIPGITRWTYVGPTGVTSGQYGVFGSIVTIVRDATGSQVVRRLEVMQESFAKYGLEELHAQIVELNARNDELKALQSRAAELEARIRELEAAAAATPAQPAEAAPDIWKAPDQPPADTSATPPADSSATPPADIQPTEPAPSTDTPPADTSVPADTTAPTDTAPPADTTTAPTETTPTDSTAAVQPVTEPAPAEPTPSRW